MKIAVLGASRGLGRELSIKIQEEIPSAELLLMSRKFDLMADFARDTDTMVACNFALREGRNIAMKALDEFQPDVLYYIAGGGPYGRYGDKDWKDHEWAFDVNLMFPAQVLHWCVKNKPANLKKVVVVGSSIAEQNPDPHAASYAAGKHGLKGLVDTLNAEGVPFDLSLFSPGYMATDMLPKNSTPIMQGEAADPRDVAKDLLKNSNLM